jgi:glucosamine-phosphate N-acetyltransferase
MTTNDFIIRQLREGDYDKGYLTILSELTTVGNIIKKEFIQRFNEMPQNHMIYVIENINTGKLMGAGTLLIEMKFIHNCSKVGHIEDIVVSKNYRKQGLGKAIVQHLSKLSEAFGCYKCILNCDKDKIGFYVKNSFKETGIEMAIYHH